jgi:trehalose 6-phosphate synthase/phosphatase
LKYKNRLIKVDVFPISIDYDVFNNAHDDVAIKASRALIKTKFADKKIIFSVDRLDYTKGVHHRLKGYEQFLTAHPEYHEKVVFAIVVVPSRDNIPKYHERKREIDETISHINSSIGNLNWQPVIYQYNCLKFDEMLALYTACDIALITPLRDGMNLVSKEFVASRKDEKGVLIISEMAGSARELTAGLSINPNDTFEIAAKIKQALEMSEQEQRERLIPMRQRIKDYDVQSWAQDFLNQLYLIKEKQKEFQIALLDDHNKGSLITAYCEANKRLLLLDYDGTLVPFSALPNLALPSTHVKNTLAQLCKDKRNDTFIISGRPAQWLEQHFADMPINLIAEHGAKMKIYNNEWITEVRKMDDWQQQVFAIMKGYEKRCVHSFTEIKEFSIVWHYRNAAPEQGKLRAAELLTELHAFIKNKNLQVLCGNKNIEVRNSGIDKGSIVKKVLNKEGYDFVLAIGDDRTDEDMFHLLMNDERSYTIKVGLHASYAKYNLLTPQTVISLLDTLHQWNKQRTTKEHQFL